MLNGNNLPHELLLIGRQKRKLRNAFEKNISTDVMLSKAQISIFLASLLSKLAGPLVKAAVPLVKTILAPLGITAAASAIDAGIKKKRTCFWNNNNNFNNFEWWNEWYKTIKKLVIKTIKNETKKQKWRLLSI